MASKNNIFCATNPARISDALWRVMCDSSVAPADMLIFLPSRRAVRSVEQMIAMRMGGAAILPRLVALGEGADEFSPQDDADNIRGTDVFGDTERIVMAAKLLAADANIGSISAALPVARDLIRMTDYLENEGVDISAINWSELVDEKYAAHFQGKAQILDIISHALGAIAGGRKTVAAHRNADIRAWIDYIRAPEFDKKLIIVCASTASVPATADLMAAIANDARGRIILSGRITGNADDLSRTTNPYNSEFKFLSHLGLTPADVIAIDVGPSAIDFMNVAFSNDGRATANGADVAHCHLVECPREATEAAAAVEIAARAAMQNKSVLIITPDAAANQRIAAEFAARAIPADFSGGIPATMSAPGRAILNLFDDWIDAGGGDFDTLYRAAGYDLFDTIARLVDARGDEFSPTFDANDPTSIAVWRALRDLSDALRMGDITLNAADARAFIADAISGVVIRAAAIESKIVVLGTIESRMQTADVVILTGLNDGMFPARGYENAWLTRSVADKIGLPPGDRKVSLMSLDFMNLSCGAEVWWLRARSAGGVQTTESRFISRVMARRGAFDTDAATQILAAVASRDDVVRRPLDYSAPMPPADWSDLHVTDLELLIHNPYAFYARHILRLRVLDDYWVGVDARKFGTIVHKVIEELPAGAVPAAIVARLDAAARAELGPNDAGVIFHFWHRRFMEMAPVIADALAQTPGAAMEIGGSVQIAGRTVRARADRIWPDGVMDIKTGAAPSKKQLLDGNMPQLPLEAHMLQSGGFYGYRAATPVMEFLQLRSGDVRAIRYDAETTAMMIRGAIDKTTEVINIFSVGRAPYENRPNTDAKYKMFDDLARTRDN